MQTDARTFVEFTEAGYHNLLALASGRYRFEPYGTSSSEPHVLWRHDIDISVHRAVRLARIETENGLIATYFVRLHSEFYSVLEKPVTTRLCEIAELGHRVGLHFEHSSGGPVEDVGILESNLESERRMLEDLVKAQVEVVSFHNPELNGILHLDDDSYAGMINTMGRVLRARYEYVSDSNGYWRFRPLREVLRGEAARLHILTHPEWWTPEPMSPRSRVARAIEGRARNTALEYDDTLRRGGRQNIS